MAKRVLIIGSTGMLGHQVLKYFEHKKEFQVFDIAYRKKRRPESILCDVSNLEILEELIQKIDPKYIINCVGILIREAEESPFRAIKLNSLLPHFLNEITLKSNIMLIHVSTDCVFSGLKGGYNEKSFKDADDIYGRSKALGEVFSEKNLTIRSSIVGPDLKPNGHGLLNWFLTNNSKTVYGFNNVYWSGVTTLEMAKAIQHAINHKISGIWNLTNGIPISKYQMLKHFNSFFSKDFTKIISSNISKVSDKSLISIRNDISYQVPSYIEMFEKMKLDIIMFKNDYSHYRNIK